MVDFSFFFSLHNEAKNYHVKGLNYFVLFFSLVDLQKAREAK